MNESIKDFFNNRAAKWDAYADDDPSIIERYLSLLGIKHDSNVLDLGCGTGVLTPFLLRYDLTSVLGLDISDEMIKEAKRKFDDPRLSYRAYDFYELEHSPFASIVCYNAYPHFLDVEAFAKKACSLLVEGGRLLICHNAGRERLDAHHSHCMHVSRSLLPPTEEAKPFIAAGFKVLEADESENHYLLLLEKSK